MAVYLLYCLNGAGKIRLADDFEASNDEAAAADAREANHNAIKCEIWQLDRLVARIDAGDLSGARA